jgi:hypothetical protein
MDTLVTLVTDVRDRLVPLSSLPAQLQAGFNRVSGEINSFRKMVLQVRVMSTVSWVKTWSTVSLGLYRQCILVVHQGCAVLPCTPLFALERHRGAFSSPTLWHSTPQCLYTIRSALNEVIVSVLLPGAQGGVPYHLHHWSRPAAGRGPGYRCHHSGPH